jgi:hypothetical protein
VGTAELFRAFEQRVTASKSEWGTAVKRLLDCEATLLGHYFPSAQAGDHLTIIGSVAKNTSMTPLADVDGVFHMPVGTYARFDDYAGNGQSALLQEVRGVLTARYPRTSIRGDGPVVVVAFTSGPNVEIVPGVLFSEGADNFHADCKVPVTRNGGAWEDSDYGAEFDNFTALNSVTNGQFSRLVRYIKAWRRSCDATFRSLVLELMAAEFMRRWDRSRSGYVYDDWLVRDFLGHMVGNYYSTYALPTGKRIDTGIGWIEQAKQSHSDAITACDLGDSSPGYVTYWRRVFGNGFGA